LRTNRVTFNYFFISKPDPNLEFMPKLDPNPDFDPRKIISDLQYCWLVPETPSTLHGALPLLALENKVYCDAVGKVLGWISTKLC
jgi:hypothetical protein